MVQWRVREIAEQLGITSAAGLAERANVAVNTAYAVWVGRSLRVDRETLTKLCRALNCTPGDLLVLSEGDKVEGKRAPSPVPA